MCANNNVQMTKCLDRFIYRRIPSQEEDFGEPLGHSPTHSLTTNLHLPLNVVVEEINVQTRLDCRADINYPVVFVVNLMICTVDPVENVE